MVRKVEKHGYHSTKLIKSIKIMLYNVTSVVKKKLTIGLVIFIININLRSAANGRKRF